MTTIDTLRTVYDNLPSRDRVANHLPAHAIYETSDFGEVLVTEAALRAIDLDNLFSGRFTGAEVESVLFRAIRAAAASADPDAGLVAFDFEALRGYRVRLAMRLTGEGIAVFPV